MHNKKFLWLLICSIGLSLTLSKGLPAKQIFFSSVTCDRFKSKFSKVECSINNRKSLDLHLTTSEDILNLIGVTELELVRPEVNQKPIRHSVKFDICNVMASNAKLSLLGFYYAGIKRAANFPLRCPFKANKTFSLRELTFDASHMPFYVPTYCFAFKSKFIADGVKAMLLRVNGSFSEEDLSDVSQQNSSKTLH